MKIELSTQEELREEELHLESIEQTYKQAVEPVERKIAELRAKLVESMLKSKIRSIKLDNLDQYILEERFDFKITDEEKALEYAKSINLIRPDLIEVKKHIKKFFAPYEDKNGIHTVPEGFEETRKDVLKIKRFNG
jgi:hypothetical protein